MATVLSRKFGLLAGVSAALYIATVPLFVDNGRDLRGYSLAALLSVLATLWSWPQRGRSRRAGSRTPC